ncbi:MAG: hypothetical protein QOC59_712 [Microbacteriaceae bacterium]|nr:hypothetical protein [Microbacteriaceae bacterium]
MGARALGLVAAHAGDDQAGWDWTLDARARCDRVPDRYVWVSSYVGLAQIQIARFGDPAAVPQLARRLYEEALRTDLPEFQAWALLHGAEAGDATLVPQARSAGRGLDSPSLHRRLAELPG